MGHECCSSSHDPGHQLEPAASVELQKVISYSFGALALLLAGIRIKNRSDVGSRVEAKSVTSNDTDSYK